MSDVDLAEKCLRLADALEDQYGGIAVEDAKFGKFTTGSLLREASDALRARLSQACAGECCDGYEAQIAVLQQVIKDRDATIAALAPSPSAGEDKRHRLTAAEKAWRARSATPPATPVQPTASVEAVAKQLTWDGPFGRCGEFEYRVGEPSYTKGWRVWLGFCGKGASVGGLIVTTTAEDKPAAMAAAQADFSTRILASLTSAPTRPSPAGGARTAEDVLRDLALYLSVGGYNDLGAPFDPEKFDRKIRWGIDYFVKATASRCADKVEELSKRPSTRWGEVKAAVLAIAPEVEPIASSSPAGGVREALAFGRELVHKGWQSGQFTTAQLDMMDAALDALSSPATPEPVPANGEVVPVAWRWRPAPDRSWRYVSDRDDVPDDHWMVRGQWVAPEVEALGLIALSNPAPGHGEGGL